MFEKDKFLVELNFGSITYSVRATAHARQRMVERYVEEMVVVGNVISLGEERMNELQETQEEAIIVDEDRDLAIVIGFKNHVIHIITVLDDMNIWNNRGTRMIRLKDM